MLKALRSSARAKATARRLCAELIAQARAPAFFTRLRVEDTLDGRFDLVVLYAWLVLERLEAEPLLAQALVNEVFLQFDEALRHLGTGDGAMNRRLKTLAGMFYGRLQAYRAATSLDELTTAIWRNVYRGAEERRGEAGLLAAYAATCRSHLARSEPNEATLDFGPLSFT
jgi:cytochrome b pre-mRNA-processing protein 3